MLYNALFCVAKFKQILSDLWKYWIVNNIGYSTLDNGLLAFLWEDISGKSFNFYLYWDVPVKTFYKGCPGNISYKLRSLLSYKCKKFCTFFMHTSAIVMVWRKVKSNGIEAWCYLKLHFSCSYLINFISCHLKKLNS